MPSKNFKSLDYRVRAEFFSQLAVMEDAGLSYERAMRLLHASNSPEVCRRAKGASQMVAKGLNLAEAGKRYGLFTEFEAKLIDSALRAGRPAHIYRRLADQYATKAENLRRMIAQLALPTAILVLSILLPVLQALNNGFLGATESSWARLLLSVIEIGVVLYVVVRIPMWWQDATGTRFRGVAERFFYCLPVFGSIQMRRNLRDFSESLALMLDAGLPVTEAVPVALDVMRNDIVRDAFGPIMPLLKRGRSLTECLQGIAMIRGSPLPALAHTGETTGRLPEMLFRFARQEAEAIAFFDRQMAIWLPRIVYILLGLWLVFALLAAKPGVFSQVID